MLDLHKAYFFLLVLIVLATWSFPKHARADRDDFFKKNFAESPLNQGRSVKDPVYGTGNALPRASTPVPRAPTPNGAIVGGMAPASRTPLVAPAAPPTPDAEDRESIQIERIDGVINFVDAKHAKKVISMLLDVAKKHRLRIDRLFVIGDLMSVVSEFTPDERWALHEVVTKFVHVRKPPQGIPAKGSPAWVFYTTTGKYVGEGMDSLERLTTKSGRLKWPKQHDLRPAEDAPPAPENEVSPPENP